MTTKLIIIYMIINVTTRAILCFINRYGFLESLNKREIYSCIRI